ncbi:MAG TPA: O-antigen ligase family protein [Gemmatimonadales bacterium]|nr:O-antigen ligase family protein [Gemmatimonadales bacterium]
MRATTAAPRPPAKGGAKPVAKAALKPNLDPLRLALFALVVLSVSRLHQHFAALAALRVLLLLVAFTGIYAFLNPKKIAGQNLRLKPARMVMAVAGWACITVPFGISLGGSASFILNSYSKTILLCFLLMVAIRGPRDLLAIVWSYVIGCAALSYLALFVFGLSKAADTDVARLSGMSTFDANDLGLVLLIGLPLSLLTFQTSRQLGKIVSGVTILGIGGALARSGSRGAFVGLVVFGIALMVMLRSVPITKRLGFMFATLVGLGIAAPPGYWQQMQTIAAPTQDYNWDATDGRRAVAERGLGYMLGYPIFGLGIQNFWRAECFMSEKAANRILGHGIRCTPPHNSYIQAGAETGIPGLILWSTLVFGGITGANRLRRRLPKEWERGDPEERFLYLSSMYLPLAMIAFASTAFFLSFAWIDMVYMVTAMITGLYACVEARLPGLLLGIAGPRRRNGAPGARPGAVPGGPPTRRP